MLPSNGLRGGTIVTRQHQDPHSFSMERGDCGGRCRLDWVGYCENARRLAVDCHEDRRGAIAAQCIGLRCKRQDVDAPFSKKQCAADRNFAALDCSYHALAGEAFELSRVAEL